MVTLVTSLVGLVFGISAAWRSDWELLAPAAIATFMSLIFWFTRVRTTVTSQEVSFFQLGKRIRVPVADVHSCTTHQDRFGLGAGLRWLGRNQWGMLSGDDYLEVRHGDGASLLVSHRDAEPLAEFLRGTTS